MATENLTIEVSFPLLARVAFRLGTILCWLGGRCIASGYRRTTVAGRSVGQVGVGVSPKIPASLCTCWSGPCGRSTCEVHGHRCAVCGMVTGGSVDTWCYKIGSRVLYYHEKCKAFPENPAA